MRELSEQELRAYLEAERQEIAEEYGELTEETVRNFVKDGRAEIFHDQYFGTNNLVDCL